MLETGSGIGCMGKGTWSMLMAVSTKAASQREGSTGVEVSSGQTIDDTAATTIRIQNRATVSLSGPMAASISVCGMLGSNMAWVSTSHQMESDAKENGIKENSHTGSSMSRWKTSKTKTITRTWATTWLWLSKKR